MCSAVLRPNMTINESFKLKSKLTAEFATRVTWGWEGKKKPKISELAKNLEPGLCYRAKLGFDKKHLFYRLL